MIEKLKVFAEHIPVNSSIVNEVLIMKSSLLCLKSLKN